MWRKVGALAASAAEGAVKLGDMATEAQEVAKARLKALDDHMVDMGTDKHLTEEEEAAARLALAEAAAAGSEGASAESADDAPAPALDDSAAPAAPRSPNAGSSSPPKVAGTGDVRRTPSRQSGASKTGPASKRRTPARGSPKQRAAASTEDDGWGGKVRHAASGDGRHVVGGTDGWGE